MSRRVAAVVTGVTTTMAFALGVTAAPAVAQSADPVAEWAQPAPEVDPSFYLPSPTPDPWYSDPPALDASAPNGTILATRPATIAWVNALGVERSWQMLVQTRDSHDRPVAVPSTLIIPQNPWHLPGPRPVVSFAMAIDGLGNTCQPSWSLTQGLSTPSVPFLQQLLDRGYAVVATDHHGPRGAYAASRMHGHALLDGIRAARAFEPAGLQDSPAALVGYSGGGIATGGAAQVQSTYAPEMSDYLVGNAIGGAPVDLATAYRGMDGTIGAGLLRAAVFGVIREYPEAYGLLTRAGSELAHALRDTCMEAGGVSGVVMPPFASWTTVDDPLSDPRVRVMLEETAVGPRPDRPHELPGHPVLVFHADPEHFPGGDQFFSADRARQLSEDWCAAGVDADYLGVPGEHLSGMFTAAGPVIDWIDSRFTIHRSGAVAANRCAT